MHVCQPRIHAKASLCSQWQQQNTMQKALLVTQELLLGAIQNDVLAIWHTCALNWAAGAALTR
jgi:hypothetical protein